MDVNPYYPSPQCQFCKEKATRKFTDSVGLARVLCPACADVYRSWYPELVEEGVIETLPQ